MNQKLTDNDKDYIHELCKDWRRFSNEVGVLNKTMTLKVLHYVMTRRPSSTTLGRRAVQRFNTLNKVRWEDLIDGNGKTS